MKLLSAAICIVSLGVLTGCVDDSSGYRSGGYYSSGVRYSSYDRDRYYRDYDRRQWRERRDWRDNRDRSEWQRPQRDRDQVRPDRREQFQPRLEPGTVSNRDSGNAPVILPNGRAIYPD